MEKISFIKFNHEFFDNEGKLKDLPLRFKRDDVFSIYNSKTSHATMNSTSSNLYKALKLYINEKGFIGKISDYEYVAEIKTEKETQFCRIKKVKKDNTWKVYLAVSYDTESKNTTPSTKAYVVQTAHQTGHSGTIVLLALMPEILKDKEAKEAFDKMKKRGFFTRSIEDNFWNENTLNEFGRILSLFSDNVYRRTIENSIPEEAKITLPPYLENLSRFQNSFFDCDFEEFHGSSEYFTDCGNEIGEEAPTELPQFYLEGANNPCEIPEGFKCAKWMKDVAFEMQFSSKYGEPIRTAMLVGPAGTGKSLGCMGIANMLGLQYRHFTCNPDTELFDLFGQLFPSTGGKALSFDEIREKMGLPSIDDIMYNLESSFVKIFKRPYDNLTTESELVNEMISLVNEEAKELANSSSYTYVEGDLTKALRNGDLLEIQEVGIIQRPGVAVGLNAILENGKNAFVTLPTGEVLKKHKNCVIVLTSNDSYEGTGNLNQSVLSRMNIVHWFKNASINEMVARTKSIVTDFVDDDLLKKAASLIEEINSFCQGQGITDGVCGQRELNSFAIGIMSELAKTGTIKKENITDSMFLKVIKSHILSKVAQNEEDIEAVIDSLILPSYNEEITLRI